MIITSVLGIHHVTAIASDPQRNLDFYVGLLGLRLVKRTVNFDDPETYHLYFGDEAGTPGSIMTFFPWPGARPGRQGTGQVAVTSFAVLPRALGFWLERLVRHGVKHEGPTKQIISFRDHDGLMLELVGDAGAEARPAWGEAPGIPREHAIRGFHRVTIWAEQGDDTERMLVDTLGFRAVHEDSSTRRFAVGDGGPGTLVDVRSVGGFVRGAAGAGTVHHVAWRVPDDAAQLKMRERVTQARLDPTPVIDRHYFHSVYFREPGGVLFELATDPPGFAIDEPVPRLGERLMLPQQYEAHRAQIEAILPPIHLPVPASAATLLARRPNRVLDLRPSRDGYGAITVGKHGIGTISLYPNRVPSKRHVESALIHLEHDIIREAPGDAALRQYIEWDIDKLSAVFNSIRHQGVSFFFELMGSSSCNSFRHR